MGGTRPSSERKCMGWLGCIFWGGVQFNTALNLVDQNRTLVNEMVKLRGVSPVFADLLKAQLLLQLIQLMPYWELSTD